MDKFTIEYKGSKKEVFNYFDVLPQIYNLNEYGSDLLVLKRVNKSQLNISKHVYGYKIEDHSKDISPKWAYIDCLQEKGLEEILTSFFLTQTNWREMYSWNYEYPKYRTIKYFSIFLFFVLVYFMKFKFELISEYLKNIFPNAMFVLLVIVWAIIVLTDIDFYLNFRFLTNIKRFYLLVQLFVFLTILLFMLFI